MVRSSSDVGFSTISVIFDDGRPDRRGAAAGGRAAGPGAQGSCPPGAVPELAPDCAGDRPDLLVHGRGRRARPGPAPRDPGLVRPPAARLGAGRGGGLERRRIPDRVRGRARPRPAAALRRDAQRASSRRSRASNAAAGGHVVHKGNAEYVVRGVGWLGASTRPGDESFDPRRALRDLENVVLRRGGRRDDPARRGRPGRDRRPASAAACWRRTATRSPAAWS